MSVMGSLSSVSVGSLYSAGWWGHYLVLGGEVIM